VSRHRNIARIDDRQTNAAATDSLARYRARTPPPESPAHKGRGNR
jgi:hypothetical protein